MKNMFEDKKDQQVWEKFVKEYDIAADQQDKFSQYLDIIVQENQKYNITAITSIQGIILDHFSDSLSLMDLYNLESKKTLVDVGSGGGFPGIPLAIMNPHLNVSLVEVVGKKLQFLTMVKDQLGLDNVMIYQDDWRTFLRAQVDRVDVVTARASLQLKELFRMFKPSSPFKDTVLVYWASEKWLPTEDQTEYLDECLPYTVGQKKRNLCFFTEPK